MSDRYQDICHSTISLSWCFFFFFIHAAADNKSQHLNPTVTMSAAHHKFSDKLCRQTSCSDLWLLCLRVQRCKIYTQKCAEGSVRFVYRCGSLCTCVYTGLIQGGINAIHYLTVLRAAQSMAFSVAADELPHLTRCIIQTCRRATLTFQIPKETYCQKYYFWKNEPFYAKDLSYYLISVCFVFKKPNVLVGWFSRTWYNS